MAENELTLTMVKEWLTANKDKDEVKVYFTEITPKTTITAENVKAYLESDDGKKLIINHPTVKSYGDSRVMEAIKTHDEKMKSKIEADIAAGVEKKIVELYPDEDPKAKEMRKLKEDTERQLREFKAETEKAKADQEAEKLRNLIITRANEKKLDAAFLKRAKLDKPEDVDAYAEEIEAILKQREDKIRNELIAEGSRKPGSGKGQENKGKIDVESLSREDWEKIIKEGKLEETLANAK